MVEATRLATAGRPGEATAILQRSLDIASPEMTTQSSSWKLTGGLREWLGRIARAKSPSPVPKPGYPPGAGEFLRRSYRDRAGSRNYRLYVPSGSRAEPV